MDDELQRMLSTMASHGQDPGSQTVWERAAAAARHRRRRAAVAITAATTLALVAAGAFAIQGRDNGAPGLAAIGPRSTSAPARSARPVISFTRGYTIWTANPTGVSAPRAVTRNGCCSVSAWSPDHEFLAVNDGTQLAIERADGTVVRDLDAETIFAPSWSPDGRQIAFAASPAGGSNGGPIQVVDVDGKHPPRTVANVFAGRVAWSPDGTRIAFTALDEPVHIDIVTIATRKVTRLTYGPGTEQWDPSWSAANGRIAFASDGGIDEIGADRHGLRAIVRRAGSCCNVNSPSWSPDGKRIVYGVAFSGFEELLVVDVASGKQIELTSGANGGTNPAW